MKKNLLKSLVACAALSLCVAVAIPNAVATASADVSEFPCTFTAKPRDTEYMCYGSAEVIYYTAVEAASAGVPAGYSDSVIKVVPSSTATSCGALLDFSVKQIPVDMVDSLEFCFYIESNSGNTGSRPQLRITKPRDIDNSWVYQPGTTPSKTGEWTTETVKNTDSLFDAIADENGYLNKFELSVRSNVQLPFFVDSVTVNMLENDGVAPVITYDGEDSIQVSLGAALHLNVTAYDEQEKSDVAVEYVWGEGVTLNENGTPAEQGVYTLTLRAKDYYGNVSEKTLTVNVLQPDTQAPVINLTFTEMYLQVGTTPILNVVVTDDTAIFEVTKVWSDGALDEYGRLTEGTHTYTVTAKDTTGNVTEKVLTVYVTVEEPEYDNVIDEEMLTRCVVTFDGEASEVTYRYGDKVEKPADPVKEADEEYSYTFSGWYNGEEEWDFETDVLDGDLNLVSKWEKAPVGGSSVDSGDDGASNDDPSDDDTDKDGDSTSSDSKVDDKGETKKGCSSSAGLTASIAALISMGAAALLKGKKEK